MSNIYYVYRYSRPYGEKAPCYIGKGCRDRWLFHERQGIDHPNPHFANVFRKAARLGLEVIREKLHVGLTEDDALALEVRLISEIGRTDLGTGPLVNKSTGGDRGQHGEETRKKISQKRIGMVFSAETRRRMSDAHKGKKRSEEHRKNIGAARKGQKYSAETCRRISEALKGHAISQETRDKIAAGNKGRVMPQWLKERLAEINRTRVVTAETRAKISAIHKGKTISPEAREKMRQAKLGRRRDRSAIVANPDQ